MLLRRETGWDRKRGWGHMEEVGYEKRGPPSGHLSTMLAEAAIATKDALLSLLSKPCVIRTLSTSKLLADASLMGTPTHRSAD